MNITVLGPHRGGTSVVAGILYHSDIFMGENLLGPGHGNLTGHFEDIEFLRLHDKIIGDWKEPKVDFEPYREEYTALIRKRERHGLWGLKDPRMCFVFPYFSEIAKSTIKVITVYRDIQCIIDSLLNRGGHTEEEAFLIFGKYALARVKALASFQGPLLALSYEDIVDNPRQSVDKISRFVKCKPTPRAIAFIDSNLCHHRSKR